MKPRRTGLPRSIAKHNPIRAAIIPTPDIMADMVHIMAATAVMAVSEDTADDSDGRVQPHMGDLARFRPATTPGDSFGQLHYLFKLLGGCSFQDGVQDLAADMGVLAAAMAAAAEVRAAAVDA